MVKWVPKVPHLLRLPHSLSQPGWAHAGINAAPGQGCRACLTGMAPCKLGSSCLGRRGCPCCTALACSARRGFWGREVVLKPPLAQAGWAAQASAAAVCPGVAQQVWLHGLGARVVGLQAGRQPLQQLAGLLRLRREEWPGCRGSGSCGLDRPERPLTPREGPRCASSTVDRRGGGECLRQGSHQLDAGRAALGFRRRCRLGGRL